MEKYEELSLNIRSAFRLLAHYNQRILNLMNHISVKLSLPPLYDNSPWWCEPIIKNSRNLEKRYTTMSWLPMFFHEFHFGNSNVQFSVFIQSDSGSWEVEDWDDIDSYMDFNSSKTRFLFAVTNSSRWDVNDDVYREENWKDFLKDEYVITRNRKTIVCKSFELIDFKDEKTTNDTILNYVEYVKTKGINNIEYIE